MKSMVGIALALTLALVGCQGPRGGGGGGTAGTKPQTQEKATQAQKPAMGASEIQKVAQKTQDDLKEASKNASEARQAVAKKDWNGAKKNMDEVQDKLSDLSKNAPSQMQTRLTAVDKLANKAQASIKSHSASAKQDLDKLVSSINQLKPQEVKAGGGKPTTKSAK